MFGLTSQDVRELAPFATAFAAVLVWALTRVAGYVAQLTRRRAMQRAMIRALFAEIDMNAADLAEFVNGSPPIEAFRQAFRENESFVPYIADAGPSRDFYEAHLREIAELTPSFLPDVVRFYDGLAKISAQIEAVQSPAFQTISVEGKTTVIQRMLETAGSSAERGASILEEMRSVYRKLDLRSD
ncbi:MAG: hypothetical protein AAFU61_02605 [Pseudomonadota bacterium]